MPVRTAPIPSKSATLPLHNCDSAVHWGKPDQERYAARLGQRPGKQAHTLSRAATQIDSGLFANLESWFPEPELGHPVAMARPDRIFRIEKIILRGTRPRNIGHNARIGNHGSDVADSVVRIHTDRGAVGVGWSGISREGAEGLLGKAVGEVFRLPEGSLEEGRTIDLPLWDLAAKLAGLPLYRFLGGRGSREVELYDGSIYIDDLQASDEEAVRIFHEEVRTGQEYGYRNFKIKIGRGARWMPPEQGLDRDVLVIHAVREAAGADAKILIDANMGNTLNTAQQILARCADVGITWFEEPFAEDPALNEALKAFIEAQGLGVLVADGEFAPPPYYFDLVRKGFVDVVQHDFRAMGLTWWKATADRIEPWGARCGPHCWGSIIERYAHAHFAASIPHYALLEAAPADMPGIVLDGWQVCEGKLIVPDTPGTGFDLEPDAIEKGVNEAGGFRVP